MSGQEHALGEWYTVPGREGAPPSCAVTYSDGTPAANVDPTSEGWYWSVCLPGARKNPVAEGAVRVPGMPGMELARNHCRIMLGRVPTNVYAVSDAKGTVLGVAFAERVSDVLAAVTGPWSGPEARNLRVHRAHGRTVRALITLSTTRQHLADPPKPAQEKA